MHCCGCNALLSSFFKEGMIMILLVTRCNLGLTAFVWYAEHAETLKCLGICIVCAYLFVLLKKSNVNLAYISVSGSYY